MSFRSEFILGVMAEHRETRERTKIGTHDENHPDPKHYRYLCADCLSQGHQVEMKFVKGSTNNYALQAFNRITERPALNANGHTITKSKSVDHPAHWDRMPRAARHKCEHPARYSELRSSALYLNALALSDRSFLFQLRLPQHGVMPQHERDAEDVRSTFRFNGMKMKGVADAKDMGKILLFFADDGGDAQYDQYFHDGVRRRAFAETYFEDVREIHRYLGIAGASGKENAAICAFMFNPNTSYQAHAYVDGRNGLIDRGVYKVGFGDKMELFVRAANEQSMDRLSEESYRNGKFQSARVLVVAQSWIDPEHPYRVEMEIYTPFQAQRWEKGVGLAPPFKPVRVIDPRPPSPENPAFTG